MDVPGLPMNLVKAKQLSKQDTKHDLRGKTAEEALQRKTQTN